MTEQKNYSPGALAGATEAEFEAAKLLNNHTSITANAASLTFYWDRSSNSVQPLCDLAAAVLT